MQTSFFGSVPARRLLGAIAAWAIATSGVGRADSFTWSGGTTGGTWDTTTLNWNTGSVAWPNAQSPADSAVFSGGNAVTIASGTIYVNALSTNGSGNNSFTGAGAGSSTLAFSGSGAGVTVPNQAASFSSLTIDTGSGIDLLGDGQGFTFGSGLALTGTGAVTLGVRGSIYGTFLTLNAANPDFSGGFVASKASSPQRRGSTITGTLADSLGRGASLATGWGAKIVYGSAAQTVVNGTTAGLTAANNGMISLSGVFNSSSRDRFTIDTGAYLSGTTTQLAQVLRVGSFSASPTQAEAVFADGATIVTPTTNANIDTALAGMNLGTAADLFFGLGANFTNSAFAITVGANTPWQGFSTDGNQEGGSRLLSAGTVAVDTGDGSFSELFFKSTGVNYGNAVVPIVLGSAGSAPTFLRSGTGAVVARVMPRSQLRIDNATVGSFFASYAVDPTGSLQSLETNAIGGMDVALSAGTIVVGNADVAAGEVVTDSVGTLGFADLSGIQTVIRSATTGTASLSIGSLARSGGGTLNIVPSVSGTLLGSVAQRVYVPSDLQRGNMAAPYVVSGTNFLTDTGTAGVGLQIASYNTSAWGDGVIRNITASTAVTGSVSADSIRLSGQNLTGSGTIRLGILPDGSDAAQAGLMTVGGNVNLSVAPAMDLGGSELVVWVLQGDPRFSTTLSGPVLTSGGLSKNGNMALVLSSAANVITGPVAVNQGTLRIGGGNGLGDSATLHVAAAGTFDLSGGSDQVALLTGGGGVTLGGNRTLTVSGTGSSTFAGVISGAGGLGKGGSGTLTLSGSNSFSGGSTVSDGTLVLAAGNALGDPAGSLAVTGGTLDLGGYSVTVGGLSGSAGGTITTAATAGTTTLTSSFAEGEAVFGGSLADNGSGIVALVKSGAGTLALSGSNAYSGGTTLAAGGLDLNHASALGSGTFTIDGGTLGNSSAAAVTVAGDNAQRWTGDFAFAGTSGLNLGTGSVAMAASRTVTVESSILTVGGGIAGGGATLTKAGPGALRLSGSNAFDGSTVSAGSLIFATRVAQPPTGTAAVAAGATLGLGVSAGDTATYFGSADLDALFAGTLAGVSNSSGVSNVGIDTSAGDFTYGSNLSGPRGLVKYGANSLTLSGASSFSGGTVITDGSVVVGNASGLGTGPVSLPTGGTLNLNGQSIANAVVVAGGTLTGGTIDTTQVAAPTGAGRIAAVLDGTGFVKTGGGTLVFAGNNTFSGTTSIAAGTLVVERATGSLPATAAVTISSTAGPAGLRIDNVGATGASTQTVGPLLFEAGAGTVSLARSAAQDLLLSASGVSVAAGAAGNLVPGEGTNSAANGFAIAGQATGFIDPGLFYDGGNFAWYDAGGFVRAIDYGVDPDTQTVSGTTSVASVPHLQVTGNVSSQAGGTFTTLQFTETAASYTTGSRVTVTGILKSGTGTTSITGGWSVGIQAPSNTDFDIRVADPAGTLELMNAVNANGSNGLTKSGPGTLRLNGVNLYNGVTRPLEGSIVVTANRSLVNSTLDLSDAGSGTVSFQISGTLGGLSGSRDLGFGGYSMAVGNNNGSTAYSGVLSSGTLTKIGTGTLALSGASTLAGVTSISNGGLAIDWLANAGQASPLGTAATVNLGSGSFSGLLRYTGTGHTSDRAINLSGTTGGATLDAAGSGPFVLTGANTATGVGTKTLTLTGTSTAANSIGSIAGAGVSVAKTGPGRWRLSGASDFDGRLTVQEGTIVAATGAGQTGAGAFGGGTGPAQLPVVGDSADGATGQAAVLLESGVTVARGLSIAALGSGASQEAILGTTATSGTATFAGGMSIKLGRDLTLQAADGGTVKFANAWEDLASGTAPAVAFNVGSAGNAGTVVFDSLLPDSITTVNVRRGTLRLGPGGSAGDETIGFATPVSLGETGAGGTLDVNGTVQSLSSLAFAGTASSVSDGFGAGSLTLYNSGSAAAVSVAGTGHAISVPVALDDAATVTVATGGRLGISGVIADGLVAGQGLTKAGLGILELAGANTFTGNTTVSAGTLVANGSLAEGALSVAAGATLMGSGTIGGAATIFGIHAPGNSPGVETFADNLTYSGGSSEVIWELWGNTTSNSPTVAFDQIVVSGNLDFAAATSLELDFGTAAGGSTVDWNDSFWGSEKTWTLYDVAGTTTNFGNFSLTGSPSTWFDANNQSLATVRPQGTFSVALQGSDVTISYVPEPAAAVLALAGLGLAAAVRLRRRR